MLPLAAMLVRSAISRAREYQADATGAQNCRNPLALANALEKLEAGSHRRPMEVNEAVSHLFIVNPLSGITASLFSTHPPIRDRVARLRQMRGLGTGSFSTLLRLQVRNRQKPKGATTKGRTRKPPGPSLSFLHCAA